MKGSARLRPPIVCIDGFIFELFFLSIKTVSCPLSFAISQILYFLLSIFLICASCTIALIMLALVDLMNGYVSFGAHAHFLTPWLNKFLDSQLEEQYRWKVVMVSVSPPLIPDHLEFVIQMQLLR